MPAPIQKRRVFHLTKIQVIFLLSMPPVHCVIVGHFLPCEERDIGILEREQMSATETCIRGSKTDHSVRT